METGTVVFFNPKRGWGYIKPDNGGGAGDKGDLFVHWQNINMEGFRALQEGQRVKFILGHNDKGPQAVQVEVI